METKIIQIKVRDDTIRELKQIQEKINAPSVSDTVRRSVGIAYALTNYVDEGDKIYVETKNGERKKLIIAGME